MCKICIFNFLTSTHAFGYFALALVVKSVILVFSKVNFSFLFPAFFEAFSCLIKEVPSHLWKLLENQERSPERDERGDTDGRG